MAIFLIAVLADRLTTDRLTYLRQLQEASGVAPAYPPHEVADGRIRTVLRDQNVV